MKVFTFNIFCSTTYLVDYSPSSGFYESAARPCRTSVGDTLARQAENRVQVYTYGFYALITSDTDCVSRFHSQQQIS